MKYLLVFAVGIALTSCGQTSLLAGKTIEFPEANGGWDLINLSTSNTYTEVNSVTCTDAGTWKDLNAGSTEGVVCFCEQASSGSGCGYVGECGSYSYFISNNTVDLSNFVINNPTCN